MYSPSSLNKLNTTRTHLSQNYQSSRHPAPGSSHHKTDTQSNSDPHPAPPASISCLNGVENRSEGHQSLKEEPVSPSTITRSQRRPRVFSTTNQTIAYYLSANKVHKIKVDGPSMSANFGRPGRPDVARQEPHLSRQPQALDVQVQPPSKPNSSSPVATRSYVRQRRGAIDCGRQYGPLATVQDDETEVEDDHGEGEDEKPCEILVRLREPFKAVESAENDAWSAGQGAEYV